MLVIALLMGVLTIFGGSKLRVDVTPLPAQAVVLGEGTPAIRVDVDGRETEYRASDGYVLRGGPGEWILRRERRVNKFLDVENIVLLAKDASFIAIMAVGMTAIIVMGGIDLSVGSSYALAALVGTIVLRALQANALGVPGSGTVPSEGGASAWASVPVGLLLCCAVGAACGLANGVMIVGLRVHPFIITLGTMAVLRGTVFVASGGQSLTGIPDSFGTGFFKAPMLIGKLAVYPVPMLIMLLVAIAGHLVLTRVVLGRRVYAVGGNETAAYYAGIPVGRVKIIIYTLCGLCAGLSACVYIGYYAAVEPNAGDGYELNVIAAAVIGGASLSGGRGSALGAVLGAILIQLIANGMIILNIPSAYTKIVMGAAIVVAVVMDQVKTRLSGGRGA